ncbi:substrate-binding domain-containing protein [Romboutsia sp.]|uniref:substrate-binding domain-containing protein n=1 Tax=Romboutsia sp. TaxID=1965302 RepID=UPI002BA6F78B|nr:substrate-binding domain-containing protein [Romboutsia sp.]HSQ87390.1 substrate-binding domain-containing protein [Romboutsia sp.]
MSKKFFQLLMLGMLSVSMVACSSTYKKETTQNKVEISKEIILATTTNLEDTGFLEDTLKDFEKENNVDVKVVAKGTGESLELGKRKDADVLFINAKDKEGEFIEKGYGVDRSEIMYDYFVVVGPKGEEHNENLKQMNVEDVFKYIKQNNLNFLSRGDVSGTHIKELSIWENSGVENEFENYNEVDKGMEATLQMASEMRAYTLTNIGTYLATKDNLDLEIVKQADESLKNVYSIVTISDLDEERKEIADKLVKYYKSEKLQNQIKKYGVDKHKEALFYVFE